MPYSIAWCITPTGSSYPARACASARRQNQRPLDLPQRDHDHPPRPAGRRRPGRLQIGTVAGFTSEQRPASDRYPRPASSEYPAASLAAPDLTEFPQPPGAFTSRLPTGRSPFPPLDMTTTATGLLCWRDFHPQEWQLASLHQTRTCRFPASGSSGESFAPGDVAMDDPGFVDHPSNDAVRDSPVEEAPQMAMVSAPPGLALARLAIRCRFVDRFAGLRVPSRVSRQRFSAPDASLPSDGSR